MLEPWMKDDIRVGWSVRVIAGIRRVPAWEEVRRQWKAGKILTRFGHEFLSVMARITKVHPRI